MKDLKPKIDQIIWDIRASNYGMAEERLFRFLDDLDELQREKKSDYPMSTTPSGAPFNWK